MAAKNKKVRINKQTNKTNILKREEKMKLPLRLLKQFMGIIINANTSNMPLRNFVCKNIKLIERGQKMINARVDSIHIHKHKKPMSKGGKKEKKKKM